jgi:hypothetical protein
MLQCNDNNNNDNKTQAQQHPWSSKGCAGSLLLHCCSTSQLNALAATQAGTGVQNKIAASNDMTCMLQANTTTLHQARSNRKTV